MRAHAVLLVPFLVAGCTSARPAPTPLPPLGAAPLTTERTIRLVHALGKEVNRPPSDPAALKELLAEGWGDTAEGPPLTVTAYTLDGMPPPTPSPTARLVIRFVHLADTQLADDESPARLVTFDTMASTSAAFRPQEAWGCRMLQAAVRTVNKIHEALPIDLVVLGGDNADNAQTNEIDWFRAILGGAPEVDCDSGADDDPEPGPDNDPKDPFVAEGLAMPWRWVTGNHDVLTQGNINIDVFGPVYTGTEAEFGTRDWSAPDLPTTFGPVVADERRAPLTRPDLYARIAADGDGHGLTPALAATGKAFYSFDAPGGGLRFVVLDTAMPMGSDGRLLRADVEGLVRPMLEQAERDGVPVVLLSHHGATSLTTDGAPPGEALTRDEWRTFLGQFPHVALHLGAHTHMFRAEVITPMGGHPFFEAETSSLIDWPGQLRLFEVWDEGNGLYRFRGIPIDFAVENDPVAAEGRRRMAADYASGWVDDASGPGPADQQAIELWFRP